MEEDVCRSYLLYEDNGDGTTKLSIHVHETDETYIGIIAFSFIELLESISRMPDKEETEKLVKDKIIIIPDSV